VLDSGREAGTVSVSSGWVFFPSIPDSVSAPPPSVLLAAEVQAALFRSIYSSCISSGQNFVKGFISLFLCFTRLVFYAWGGALFGRGFIPFSVEFPMGRAHGTLRFRASFCCVIISTTSWILYNAESSHRSHRSGHFPPYPLPLVRVHLVLCFFLLNKILACHAHRNSASPQLYICSIRNQNTLSLFLKITKIVWILLSTQQSLALCAFSL